MEEPTSHQDDVSLCVMSVFPPFHSLQDRVKDLEQQLELAEWYRKRLDSTREQLRVVDLQLAAAVATSQDALHAAMDVAEHEGATTQHHGELSRHSALTVEAIRTVRPGTGRGAGQQASVWAEHVTLCMLQS